MELGKIIAFNLKRLRMERNLSQGQLAKEAGISKAMLSDIEKGGSNPTINTIWKIANGLNVPYTKLMDGIDDEATVVQRKDTIEQSGESSAYWPFPEIAGVYLCHEWGTNPGYAKGRICLTGRRFSRV